MIKSYTKEVLVKGRPTEVRCIDVQAVTLTVGTGVPRIVSLEDEWFAEISDPEEMVRELRACASLDADLLAFWNPLPESVPRYAGAFEVEEVAVLPISSYEDWWKNRIKSRTRNLIRKAEKQGLAVREMEFNQEFVQGVTEIFNEQPIRQGRKFWHYGKDADTVRQQFSRYVHRETMIGAFVGEEMMGFIMLGSGGRCAHLGQILSKVSARELNPSNALMAKAVEICARMGHEYLVYGYWGDTSLAEFKRRCGFEPVAVPHYFLPLSRRGELLLRCGLHRGWTNLIPPRFKSWLRRLRAAAYEWRGTE